MKRIVSVFLATLFICLSFVSCGKEQASSPSKDSSAGDFSTGLVDYSVDFEDIRKGYITHTTQTSWSVTESEGFECIGDFYISLPAGSTLSCEKNFAAYCYSGDFTLNPVLTEACGQTLFGYSPKMAAGELTLTDSCYVRLAVSGSLSDIKIKIPKGSEKTVLCGSETALLYFPQIKTLGEKLSGKESAVNYIFITDIHYGNDAIGAQGSALITQVKAAVEIANTVDSIDFVVIGGDTTTGMYQTKADAIKYTIEVLSPLKDCKKPVLVLMGNHDDNSYHSYTYNMYYPDRIVSDKDWNDNILEVFCPDNIVKDSGYKYSKYYYYDLEAKKTRVICLDALDYRAEFDSKGVIRELPKKDPSSDIDDAQYWSGCSWWGYSEKQMKWLANEAMTADKDWDYVFLSHMGIDSDTNSYRYDTKYGKILRDIIRAYQNKSFVASDTVTADFSNTKGRILSYQFGHQHLELTHYSRDINLWQITTATASVGASSTGKTVDETDVTNKRLDWKIYNRALGSESEACFDIMSVSDKIIFKYAFGAGSDEELEY